MENIRNFCIIAHIDHGKSTLADRFLEITGTVEKRAMKEQLLDTMDIERERGITIKLQPVRMQYRAEDGVGYMLNLIDTPGHVDFTYEVSRSLAAVEGAILLVDATQGVQAQTIGNLYLALEQDLTIIPVVNKIDMPSADREKTRDEIVHLIGCDTEDIIYVSGKTGEGVDGLLEAVVDRIKPPVGDPDAPLRALVFDSFYDIYKGVVAYTRVVDGSISRGVDIHLAVGGVSSESIEVGFFSPKYTPADSIKAGEIGYIVTGFKDIEACKVGDTVTVQNFESQGVEPLAGYKEVKPMVFAGVYPQEGNEYEKLRDAMLKLKLSDSALTFEPEQQQALGFGFRCGLLGLLHLEIVQERLRREHGIEVVITAPSVAYEVLQTNGEELVVKSALNLPEPTRIVDVSEPWVTLDIIAPKEHVGNVMVFVQERRGIYKDTEYMTSDTEGATRVILHYEIPLASILVDFYDKLKSVTSGYGSMNYEVTDYRKANVVRLDILVAEDPVDALAFIVYRDEAEREGRKICKTLKDTLPRQQFVVKIQAAVGGKIVAAERLSAYRKDVTKGLYGGDVTRKMKVLEKQKKGKKRMGKTGKVDIPPDAFMAVLKKK